MCRLCPTCHEVGKGRERKGWRLASLGNRPVIAAAGRETRKNEHTLLLLFGAFLVCLFRTGHGLAEGAWDVCMCWLRKMGGAWCV